MAPVSGVALGTCPGTKMEREVELGIGGLGEHEP